MAYATGTGGCFNRSLGRSARPGVVNMDKKAGAWRFEMSISKKLFIGFGLILGIVSLLFLGDFFAVVHEHNTKDTFFKSIEMRKAMSNLFQERMNNRLRLRNFLLSGDVKEADSLKAGENHIDTLVNI